MAQRKRAQGTDQNILTLQIPQRAGPVSGPQVIQIPNGYQFELSGVKVNITSTVTQERQMINISIDLESLVLKGRK